MAKINFRNASFSGSYTSLDAIPPVPSLQMVLIGRSNVGKSSLINALTQKPIAKTSSTPGKTQTINLYLIDDKMALFDLPGYGYAKMKQERLEWGNYLNAFFETKGPQLSMYMLCIDIRHALSEEDKNMLVFLRQFEPQLLVIFTKTDKLKPLEQKKNIEQLCHQIKENYLKPFEILPFSNKIPSCCKSLEKMMELWVN